MHSILVVVLLIMIALLVMRGWSFSVFTGAVETEVVDKTAAIGDGGKLSVINKNGGIQIGTWDGNEVKIHAVKKTRYGDEELKKTDIKITLSGNDLEIKTVSDGWNVKVSVEYEILVPAHALVDKIVTSNGSINISDVRGNVTAESSNGSITAAGLKGGIAATTSNGSIKLNGAAGAVTAGTTNGGIHIQNADSVFAVETTNGNVDVEFKKLPETDVSIASTNGSVTVRAADGLNADVEMSTSNGHVSAKEMTLSGVESTRTRLNGKLGTGGIRLRIETSNGNATLKKL